MSASVAIAGRPVLAPPRVVIQPEPYLPAEEELYILGALEELKLQHDRIRLVYVTGRQEIQEILKGQWFLEDHRCLGDFSGFSADVQAAARESNDRFLQSLVQDGTLLTLDEPDIPACVAAEERLYRQEYDAELAKIQQQMQMAERVGAKDYRPIVPTFQFAPSWHKTNGYLWQIVDELGLSLAVPRRPLPPFGQVPRRTERDLHRKLAAAHLTDQPFVLYDFGQDPLALRFMQAIGEKFPDCKLVSRKAVEKAAGEGLVPLLAAAAHRNCRRVVGRTGLLPACAWASGLKTVITLYSGTNPAWDSTHAANDLIVARDQYDDESVPQVLAHVCGYAIEREGRV